ncbi:uncharacterized protein TNCV_3807431, partial [Trichonephila clavipes]
EPHPWRQTGKSAKRKRNGASKPDNGDKVAEESMKMAAVEEYSSSPDNLLTVSGDSTWKTRGHSSLIGVCTVLGAETGKVLDREALSSFCKGCDSYKGVKFGIKYNKNGKERIRFHVEKIILALLVRWRLTGC